VVAARAYCPRVIYQDPLAYLVGLQGVALLRAFTGGYDKEFIDARLAELRALLDAAEVLGPGTTAHPIGTEAGYREWAHSYDRPGNQLIDIEGPLVRAALAGLPVGVAVDAACGTGRHATYLAALGHRVIGVDSSPDMLAVARTKLPDAELHLGDLHQLPVADGAADLVLCALALNHVPDLAPALAEFVRVLRPGGHLGLSDSREMLGLVALPFVSSGPDGAVFMPNHVRPTSDYLEAALPLGLQVRGCTEPRRPQPFVDPTGTPPGDVEPVPDHVPGEPPDIWSLHPWAVAATNAAYRDMPAAIIWHFQLAGA
jgi:SAM-dependent methyltransferase